MDYIFLSTVKRWIWCTENQCCWSEVFIKPGKFVETHSDHSSQKIYQIICEAHALHGIFEARVSWGWDIIPELSFYA